MKKIQGKNMEEIRAIIEGLTKEEWDSTKVEFKELKEQIMELDKFINNKEDSESDIQLIYEEIIPHIENIKESLFKISVLEKIKGKWKAEEEELKKK